MIQRIWHGYTAPENAEAYETLLKEDIMPGIANKQIPGYLGMQILRRVSEENQGEIEFITIMNFSKLEDIKGFVGKNYAMANLPEKAVKLMKRYDTQSQHYDIRDQQEY
ncbi:antibiotic biosynthesis monooxygenase [Flavobacteriaceae bacterium AU392]|nr:antibiotic biosynthesis monooxygenase [Flavobacteriaceae bacterium]RKM86559.1 antibiotic biosynthesis monooxygenase [Flavobacteriaceae bacterium AU392]